LSTKNATIHKGFWQLADPKIWIASTVPMILGVLLSWASGRGFSFFWMVVSFIGIYLIEIGKNAINEIVDYMSGADIYVDKEHRNAFSGGKKTIVDGLLDIKHAAVIAIVTMFLAACIGLLIVFFREPLVIYMGIAGFILAIIYSLPPFKLCYRGLGEVTVGVVFGPLVLNGMYVVMAGQYELLPILVSIPVGLLIANVLWINQFPDYEADAMANKRNWVVRLGKENSVKVYAAIFILAYIFIGGIAIYTMNPIWLIGILTAPKAVKAVKNCRQNFNNVPELLKSNGATIQIYVLNGILLGIAVIINGRF
jgi:1,4-dihydroxy-2-naphthoate octaprenyltransferase